MRFFTKKTQQVCASFLLTAFFLPFLLPQSHGEEGATGQSPSLSLPQEDAGDDSEDNSGDVATGDTEDDSGDVATGDTEDNSSDVTTEDAEDDSGDNQDEGSSQPEEAPSDKPDDSSQQTPGSPELSNPSSPKPQSDEAESGNTGTAPEVDLLSSSAVYSSDGSLTLTTPKATGDTYTIEVLKRYYTNDGTLVDPFNWHDTDVCAVDGNTRRIVFAQQYKNSEYIGTLGVLSNVGANKNITFSDIIYECTQESSSTAPYKTFDYVIYEISGYQENTHKNIFFSGDSTKFSIELHFDSSNHEHTEEMGLSTILTTDTAHETDDTFLSLVTDYQNYNALYLLNYYSAVTPGDLESTHIIGPVLIGGYVARYNHVNGVTDGVLSIADYTQEVFSYVGEIPADSIKATQAAFSIYNGFDETPGTNIPNLYTSKNHQTLANSSNSLYVIPTDTSVGFPSPNHNGTLNKTFRSTSDFINWTSLTSQMSAASNTLLSDGVLSGTSRSGSIIEIDLNTDKSYYDSSTGLLTLDHGKSYKVYSSGSTNLQSVIIDYTATDKDFVYAVEDKNLGLTQSQDSIPTTINLMTSALPKASGFSIFPKTEYIDSTTKGASAQPPTVEGEGNEYTTVGNKVIWNLPESQDMVMYSDNVLGHILAPLTNIYSYGTTYSQYNGWQIDTNEWMGGNINGTVIANTALLGKRELHFWPYMTLDEIAFEKNATSLSLTGTKKTNTGYFLDDFTFTLTADSGNPNGCTMPSDTSALSNVDGLFSFDKIYFSGADNENTDGTENYVYQFTVKEEEGNSTYSYLGFDYDKTVYTIVVTVTRTTKTVDSVQTSTYTIQDVTVDGTALTVNSEGLYDTASTLTFLNEYAVTELPDTGGSGTTFYTIFGISMLALSLCVYRSKKTIF